MSTKKNFGFLIGGTALAQVFTFAISPILTRLYTPESFGVLGVILAASSIIAVFAHLRLNLAIAKSKNINEAIIILKTSMFFSILVCLLSSIFLLISNIIFNNSYTFIIVAFVFLVSLANVLIDIFNYWQSYRGKHNLSARNAVVRSFSTGITQIVLGLFNNFGLVFGVIVGSAVSLFLFLKEFLNTKNMLIVSLNKKRILFVLRKYKEFPLYSMPQGLIASSSLNSVPIILGSKFGVAVAGQYWLAYRILLAPIALIGGAYRQALHPIYSKIAINDKIKMTRRHTIFFLLLFFPFTILVFLFSELLFISVFGLEWRVAGEFAAWLILCFGLDIAKVPSICFLQASGHNKFLLYYEIFVGVFRILTVLILSAYSDYLNTVKFFSISSTILTLMLIFICLFMPFRLGRN